MPDMLVRLYDLPDPAPHVAELKAAGIEIKRAIAPEKHVVVNWVRETFGAGWASECDVAFSNHPVSCLIATESGRIVGFACYDATYRDFFGPTGVKESHRKRKIGKTLLLATLHAMYEQGYAYAIIGGVGPVEFYAKVAGAVPIENSTPGVYRGMLKW